MESGEPRADELAGTTAPPRKLWLIPGATLREVQAVCRHSETLRLEAMRGSNVMLEDLSRDCDITARITKDLETEDKLNLNAPEKALAGFQSVAVKNAVIWAADPQRSQLLQELLLYCPQKNTLGIQERIRQNFEDLAFQEHGHKVLICFLRCASSEDMRVGLELCSRELAAMALDEYAHKAIVVCIEEAADNHSSVREVIGAVEVLRDAVKKHASLLPHNEYGKLVLKALDQNPRASAAR